MIALPNGYFHEGHLVFGDLGKGGILAKGYAVEFPDLSASDPEEWESLESTIRLMLSSLKSDESLQLHFYTSSDFSAVLTRFEAQTRSQGTPPITAGVRDELVSRFRARMERETLIQTNARLFLSSRIPKLAKEGGRVIRGFDEVFKVIARSFEGREQFFRMLLGSYGGGVLGLDNLGHYQEMLRYWSPGQARQPLAAEIDWLESISDLCRTSDIAPRSQPDHGFRLDGYVAGVWVLKSFPRSTWQKTMQSFFDLAIPNIRVVVNMRPLEVDKEIQHEEERFGKLVSNLDPQNPVLVHPFSEAMRHAMESH